MYTYKQMVNTNNPAMLKQTRVQATLKLTTTTDLKKVNLKSFSAEQVKDLANEGMTLVTTSQLETIFAERNKFASKNSKMALEIARLTSALEEREKGSNAYQITGKSLTELSDDELKLLGLVTIDRANAAINQLTQKVIHIESEYKKVVADNRRNNFR